VDVYGLQEKGQEKVTFLFGGCEVHGQEK